MPSIRINITSDALNFSLEFLKEGATLALTKCTTFHSNVEHIDQEPRKSACLRLRSASDFIWRPQTEPSHTSLRSLRCLPSVKSWREKSRCRIGRTISASSLSRMVFWTSSLLMRKTTLWQRFLTGMPADQLSFVLRASFDCLPCPSSLVRWGYSLNRKCPLCNGPLCNVQHVLNCCPRALTDGRYTWRHDMVLTALYSHYCRGLIQKPPSIYADLPDHSLTGHANLLQKPSPPLSLGPPLGWISLLWMVAHYHVETHCALEQPH